MFSLVGGENESVKKGRLILSTNVLSRYNTLSISHTHTVYLSLSLCFLHSLTHSHTLTQTTAQTQTHTHAHEYTNTFDILLLENTLVEILTKTTFFVDDVQIRRCSIIVDIFTTVS